MNINGIPRSGNSLQKNVVPRKLNTGDFHLPSVDPSLPRGSRKPNVSGFEAVTFSRASAAGGPAQQHVKKYIQGNGGRIVPPSGGSSRRMSVPEFTQNMTMYPPEKLPKRKSRSSERTDPIISLTEDALRDHNSRIDGPERPVNRRRPFESQTAPNSVVPSPAHSPAHSLPGSGNNSRAASPSHNANAEPSGAGTVHYSPMARTDLENGGSHAHAASNHTGEPATDTHQQFQQSASGGLPPSGPPPAAALVRRKSKPYEENRDGYLKRNVLSRHDQDLIRQAASGQLLKPKNPRRGSVTSERPPADFAKDKAPQKESTLKVTCKFGCKSIAGATAKGMEKTNQDAFMMDEINGVTVVGVFDGHGANGHHVSQFLAHEMLRRSQRILETSLSTYQVPGGGALFLVKVVDQTIAALHRTQIDTSCSGSTAVVGVVFGSTLTVANIGDSRSVLGKAAIGAVEAVPLTVDHSPTVESECARIKQLGGRIARLHEGQTDEDGPLRVWGTDADTPGLAMTRSVGDDMLTSVGVIEKPELTERPLRPGELFVVFASDGVWEFMSNERACQIALQHSSSAEVAATAIADEAKRLWAGVEENVRDDITAVVLSLSYCHVAPQTQMQTQPVASQSPLPSRRQSMPVSTTTTTTVAAAAAAAVPPSKASDVSPPRLKATPSHATRGDVPGRMRTLGLGDSPPRRGSLQLSSDAGQPEAVGRGTSLPSSSPSFPNGSPAAAAAANANFMGLSHNPPPAATAGRRASKHTVLAEVPTDHLSPSGREAAAGNPIVGPGTGGGSPSISPPAPLVRGLGAGVAVGGHAQGSGSGGLANAKPEPLARPVPHPSSPQINAAFVSQTHSGHGGLTVGGTSSGRRPKHLTPLLGGGGEVAAT